MISENVNLCVTNPLRDPSDYDWNFSNVYPKSSNHKRISLFYLIGSLCFGISGTCLSIIIRNEIDTSTNRIIHLSNFNIYLLSITTHGLLMIFFLVMPGLFGSFESAQLVVLPIDLNEHISSPNALTL